MSRCNSVPFRPFLPGLIGAPWVFAGMVNVTGNGSKFVGFPAGHLGHPPVVMVHSSQLSGSNFCTRSTPCAACFGDCDDDGDCQADLVCEQREPGGAAPNGCAAGGAGDLDGEDYCVPPEPAYIVTVSQVQVTKGTVLEASNSQSPPSLAVWPALTCFDLHCFAPDDEPPGVCQDTPSRPRHRECPHPFRRLPVPGGGATFQVPGGVTSKTGRVERSGREWGREWGQEWPTRRLRLCSRLQNEHGRSVAASVGYKAVPIGADGRVHVGARGGQRGGGASGKTLPSPCAFPLPSRPRQRLRLVRSHCLRGQDSAFASRCCRSMS